jgi:hypothetical protein
MAPVYCPHCSQEFAQADGDPAPPRPLRCPHCRLVIGAGRGRAKPDRGQPGAAAGLIANEARRSESESETTDADRARAASALVYVASRLGIPIDRLTLTLYRDELSSSPLPAVQEVIQAFGSWKLAQAEATRLMKAKKRVA